MALRVHVAAAALAVGLGLLPVATTAHAETLREMLDQMLPGHNRMKAAEADVTGATNMVEVARGSWYPTLTTTIDYGYESQNKPSGSVDTDAYLKRYEVQLKQMLWDFGAANANIDKAELAKIQAETSRTGARQALVLDALTAYVNLVRTSKQLSFARESESNIRKQTGLEQARVDRGSGLATDVLQAKSQLARAEADRVAAEGAMTLAQNRFRAVFTRSPADLSTLALPPVPRDIMPQELDGAIATAKKGSIQLKLAQLAADSAIKASQATEASQFYPRLDLIGEARNKQNYGGTMGNQTEQVAKVELTYPFNLGFTAINSLRASDSAVTAANHRLADAHDTVEEQVRNAWNNLATQQSRADYLKNQSNIANEFLELARKERKLGNRSLIDVLSGETALIRANSDAAAAEADVAIAAFTLLSTMGQLDENAIR